MPSPLPSLVGILSLRDHRRLRLPVRAPLSVLRAAWPSFEVLSVSAERVLLVSACSSSLSRFLFATTGSRSARVIVGAAAWVPVATSCCLRSRSSFSSS